MNKSSLDKKDTVQSINKIVEDLMNVASNDILLNINENNKSTFNQNTFNKNEFILKNSPQIKKIFLFALKQKKKL